jgi:chemotaxis protein MotB
MSDAEKKQEEQEEQKKKRKKRQAEQKAAIQANTAAWIMTFADLMSLLMAFFVMLFALSEVDKDKFRLLGYSMKQAFGVPVSVMLENNSDTRTIDPATRERMKKLLEEIPELGEKKFDFTPTETKPEDTVDQASKDQEKYKQTKEDVEKLKKVFGEEIKAELVTVEQEGDIIIIQVAGGEAFGSGSPELNPEILDTINKFANSSHELKGEIVISGHTDNIPLEGGRYRSNWELSAARAASVAHVLEGFGVNKSRVSMRAYADTKGIAPNDTEENRAKNRRIEIMIDQSRIQDLVDEIQEDKKPDQTAVSEEDLSTLSADTDTTITDASESQDETAETSDAGEASQ